MTKTWARRSVQAGALAAGFLLLTGGAAQAGSSIDSIGNQGVANGNQLVAPIQAPVNVCGNAVGALAGVAGAGCDGGAWASQESGALGDMTSAGNNGLANGNQVQAPIQVPIDACGNAVGALIGAAGAGCDGGSSADISKKHGHSKVTESGGDMASIGNNGLGNGNQVQAPIQVPINVCGNAIAVLGVAGAGCDGGAWASQESGALGDMISAGNNGLGNGNQVQAPIQVPINVCGNAIAVLGVAGAGCDGGASADISKNKKHHHHAAESQVTEVLPTGLVSGVVPGADQLPVSQTVGQTASTLPGADTVGGLGLPTDGITDGLTGGQGLQVPNAPADAPAPAAAPAAPAESGVTENLGDMLSADNNGLLNGNQLQLPIQVPVDISGNAIGILGVAGAGSSGGSSASMN